MVAGGGASVIYADTIVDMGGVNELANYGKSIYCLRAQYSKVETTMNILNVSMMIIFSLGEYSGGPNEQQTYVYAKTVLDLMCRHPHVDGKVLIIGGGIANFTNVADTFKVRSLIFISKTKFIFVPAAI